MKLHCSTIYIKTSENKLFACIDGVTSVIYVCILLQWYMFVYCSPKQIENQLHFSLDALWRSTISHSYIWLGFSSRMVLSFQSSMPLYGSKCMSLKERVVCVNIIPFAASWYEWVLLMNMQVFPWFGFIVGFFIYTPIYIYNILS